MTKNIIFDLGKVLINWDIKSFAQSYTKDPKLQNHIITSIFNHEDWHTLDEGTITEEEAVLRFSKRVGIEKREIEKIIKEARKIMTLKEDTYDELLRLKKSYKLYCLSNMSIGSWEVILKTHDFYKHFDDIIISAQEKVRKPNVKIFTRALKKFNIKPEETVFIDDLNDNISAAESIGIKGILFDESEKCWNNIKNL